MAQVVYIVPHQDDELLSMGVSIATHKYEGHDCIIVPLCKGEGSYIKNALNNGKSCSVGSSSHKHNISLSDREFSQARDREMIAALKQLWARVDDMFGFDGRVNDNNLTKSKAKQMVYKIIEKYPNARIKTMTPYGASNVQHTDHKALGQAVMEIYKENKIKDLRFYIETYQLDEWKKANPGKSVMTETDSRIEYRVRGAISEYELWDLSQKRYAIGKHSVGEYFDGLKNNIRSLCHAPF